MIDFSLTEEQKMLRDTIKRFVREEVLPKAYELDSKVMPQDCFSWEIIEKLSGLGIRTFMLSGEDQFLNAATSLIMLEELAFGDMGIATVLGQTWKVSRLIMKYGSEKQKNDFLARFQSDPRFLLAIAITEPDFSSDYILPYGKSRGPAFSAGKNKNGWILNGAKHFIGNGGAASLYVVFARTKKGADFRTGITAFLVPKNAAGFNIGGIHNKLGNRLVLNSELVFENCLLPLDSHLGEVNRGYEVLTNFFPLSSAYSGIRAVGLGRRIYEESVRWAKDRVQGGQPIIKHQAVGIMLSEMKMLIDAARAYAWQAAWISENREYADQTYIPLSNVFASRMAMRVAELALEVHGGYGTMKGCVIEKLFRDAAMCLHADGANNTLLLKALGHIET